MSIFPMSSTVCPVQHNMHTNPISQWIHRFRIGNYPIWMCTCKNLSEKKAKSKTEQVRGQGVREDGESLVNMCFQGFHACHFYPDGSGLLHCTTVNTAKKYNCFSLKTLPKYHINSVSSRLSLCATVWRMSCHWVRLIKLDIGPMLWLACPSLTQAFIYRSTLALKWLICVTHTMLLFLGLDKQSLMPCSINI